MLDTLKFVRGAIAKKDFVPELTHFYIKDGIIKGYNGRIGLCSPIDLDLEAYPKGAPFIKAIQTCKDTVAMHMTDSGRLSIKSGAFKTLIDCTTLEVPNIQPEGSQNIALNGKLLPALKKVAPFIAEDASRPWARGILFCNQSAFATNNIILVEYWLGYDFPRPINIPQTAIRELIRINQEPVNIQLAEKSITFHFEDGRWLRSQLFTTDWPNPYQIFEHHGEGLGPVFDAVPDGFFDAIETIAPFVDETGSVYFSPMGISTAQDPDTSAASHELSGLASGRYNVKQLMLLKTVVASVDFSGYPRPCIFTGDRIRGAIIGMV